MYEHHHRLTKAVDRAAGQPIPFGLAELDALPWKQPPALQQALAARFPGRVVVTGTAERRLLFLENQTWPGWTIADLSGRPHTSRVWPAWARDHIKVSKPGSWIADTELAEPILNRLQRPHVLVVALYHPEYFPLPRFPLAISCLARAARATLMGHVELMDMQLGVTLPDITGYVDRARPDIVGVSATFGQHDLMIELLDHLTAKEQPPLVVVGGSLTVRNEKLLLQRYPRLLVARGAGEPTIQDVMALWHGDLTIDQVRGIGYQGGQRGEGTLTVGKLRRTATVANRLQTDMWPELDLLERTLRHDGVAQLETSRGCTSSCSFCPRGHKGQWAGTAPGGMEWMLKQVGEVFDGHPDTARVLYLVDEEFIGRDDGAEPRALEVAQNLNAHGFKWETSCRIDQVVWPGKDRAWHIERGNLWRGLLQYGLRRCLFGVESGVTSILERFHKETTAEQNALAIRTLSALGVPTRFTYITFDHLMSAAELRASRDFQARTDLLLRPLPELPIEQIVDGVRDEGFVAEHATGRPFYTAISYMLVSMECLIGAAYTREVTAAGLAGQVRPSMGRVDAEFADRRIGVLSRWAQLWVDRNFALDYTLKSLEKILDGVPRSAVRGARVVLKRAAFTLLDGMLALLDGSGDDVMALAALDAACQRLAETLLAELRLQVGETVTGVCAVLPSDRAAVLSHEHARWAEAADEWTLINAADPCGT